MKLITYFLCRFAKDIYNIDEEEELRRGQLGVISIPKIWTSKYPEIASISDYKKTAARRRRSSSEIRGHQPPTNWEEVKSLGRHLCGESAEKVLFNALHRYFQDKEDDCLILTNQFLECPWNFKLYERDFVIINLTTRCLINIEAKSYLHEKSIVDPDNSRKGAARQLQMSKEILKELFEGKISDGWIFIAAMFGLGIDADVEGRICRGCRPYVIAATDEDEAYRALEKIFPRRYCEQFESSWIMDFRFMVKTLIYKGVKIDDDIINKICANSEKAGTAENVAFWSPEQYDILNEHEDNRRVLLKSSNSTGKTILMLYMMNKLLEKGDAVAFVIYQHHKKQRKSLLQLKVEEEFSGYLRSGQLVIDTITGNYIQITFKVEDFSLRHVFIDELLILYDPQGEKSYVPNVAYILEEWHKNHDPYLFFWVVIAGIDGKMSFDEINELTSVFKMPSLTYPLRNTKNIIDVVDAYQEGANSDPNAISLDVGLPGNPVKAYWNIQIPDNLTDSLPFIKKHSQRLSDAIIYAFEKIKDYSKRKNPFVMFVMGTELSKIIKDSDEPVLSIIDIIFQRCNRPLPILYSYLNESESNELVIKNWIMNPDMRQCDLITDYTTSHGFEENIVLFLQFKSRLKSPNNLLRAKSLLGILTFDKLL